MEHTALMGEAIASKSGAHLRQTVCTTLAGISDVPLAQLPPVLPPICYVDRGLRRT